MSEEPCPRPLHSLAQVDAWRPAGYGRGRLDVGGPACGFVRPRRLGAVGCLESTGSTYRENCLHHVANTGLLSGTCMKNPAAGVRTICRCAQQPDEVVRIDDVA